VPGGKGHLLMRDAGRRRLCDVGTVIIDLDRVAQAAPCAAAFARSRSRRLCACAHLTVALARSPIRLRCSTTLAGSVVGVTPKPRNSHCVNA
jgi:hypothetical protein